MVTVRRLAQFVAIALTTIILALPLSACLIPAQQMTVEQRECCQKMAGRCETSVMPSSHSCCQHPASPQAVTACKIQTNDFAPVVAQIIQAASLPLTIARSKTSLFESPPESPPANHTILSI